MLFSLHFCFMHACSVLVVKAMFPCRARSRSALVTQDRIASLQATTLNIPNVHLLQLTSLGYDAYENWCDSHPSAVAQAAVASQIATLVSSIEPSWNASSIDMNPPQSVLRPNTALYMSGSDITTFAGGPSAGAGSASSPLFAPVVLAGLQTAG